MLVSMQQNNKSDFENICSLWAPLKLNVWSCCFTDPISQSQRCMGKGTVQYEDRANSIPFLRRLRWCFGTVVASWNCCFWESFPFIWFQNWESHRRALPTDAPFQNPGRARNPRFEQCLVRFMLICLQSLFQIDLIGIICSTLPPSNMFTMVLWLPSQNRWLSYGHHDQLLGDGK